MPEAIGIYSPGYPGRSTKYFQPVGVLFITIFLKQVNEKQGYYPHLFAVV